MFSNRLAIEAFKIIIDFTHSSIIIITDNNVQKARPIQNANKPNQRHLRNHIPTIATTPNITNHTPCIARILTQSIDNIR